MAKEFHPQDFIIKVKNLSFNIHEINDKDLEILDKYRLLLIQNIENTILINPEIGKRQFKKYFDALAENYEYIKVKIEYRKKELEQERKEETKEYYRLINFFYFFDDAFHYMLELIIDYFPETAQKNRELFKKYYAESLLKNLPPDNKTEEPTTTTDKNKKGSSTEEINPDDYFLNLFKKNIKNRDAFFTTLKLKYFDNGFYTGKIKDLALIFAYMEQEEIINPIKNILVFHNHLKQKLGNEVGEKTSFEKPFTKEYRLMEIRKSKNIFITTIIDNFQIF
jgi:hypothetical protein